MAEASAAEPRKSFDSTAEIYHAIRPGYPPPMFEDLFRLLPSRPSSYRPPTHPRETRERLVNDIPAQPDWRTLVIGDH